MKKVFWLVLFFPATLFAQITSQYADEAPVIDGVLDVVVGTDLKDDYEMLPIAGGAEVCLIPEIPYNIDKVVKRVNSRYQNGRGFVNIVIAEGAKLRPYGKIQELLIPFKFSNNKATVKIQYLFTGESK